LNCTFQDITYLADRQRDLDNMKRLLAGEIDSFSMEKRYIRKDQTIMWGNLTCVPLWTEEKNVRYHLAMVEDITDRKRTEAEIKAHLSFLDSIMEQSPFAMWISDTTGTVIRTNRALRETLNLTDEQIVGKYNVLQDDNLIEQDVMPQVRSVFEDRKPARFSIPWVGAKAGDVDFEGARDLWIDVSMFPIFGSEGNLINVVCQWVNVTERVRAEKALRESEEKYRILFESFPLGITVSDKDGNILETNAVAETLLGVSKEEHEERTIDGQEWTIIRPDGMPMPAEEYASVRALKENRVITNVEMGIVRPDRDVTWINVTAAPIPLENYGVAITYSDISVRKRMEEQIKRSLQEKTVLLREIHHRVKNNMQSIVSLLRLQHTKITHQADLNILEEVEQRIRAMAIIHEMLYQADDFARLDFGRYVQSLIYGIWGAYGSAASHITPLVDVDQVLLGVDVAIACGLLVNELVVNCLKHAFPNQKEGEVRVSLHKKAQTIELIVSDTGIGLPENADLNTSHTLGFTLIHGWVNQVQGTLEIDRTAGTCFRITFQEPVYKTPGGS
jgi:PAS domain S-box-containing protein